MDGRTIVRITTRMLVGAMGRNVREVGVNVTNVLAFNVVNVFGIVVNVRDAEG